MQLNLWTVVVKRRTAIVRLGLVFQVGAQLMTYLCDKTVNKISLMMWYLSLVQVIALDWLAPPFDLPAITRSLLVDLCSQSPILQEKQTGV